MPTNLTVSVDATEYCKYETGRELITASVSLVGLPVNGEQIAVSLRKARRGRDVEVAAQTVTVTSHASPAELEVVFNLRNLVDADNIPLVRHGRYFVHAELVSDPAITGDSADFDLVVMTVQEFRSRYLFGLPAVATDQRFVRSQPDLAGVSVVSVSPGYPVGLLNIAYTYLNTVVSNASASIGSGANGVVTITSPTILGAAGNQVTIQVVQPLGTSPLAVSVLGTHITVQLAVASGVLVAGANTAELVAAALSLLPEYDAEFSGDGSGDIGPSTTTQMSGGVSTVLRTLSVDNGTPVSITRSGLYTLISGGGLGGSNGAACGVGHLASMRASHWIVVKVDLQDLPTVSGSAQLLVDKKEVSDSTIKSLLDQSVAWVENDYLDTRIEPTAVITEKDSTVFGQLGSEPAEFDWDFIVPTATWYEQNSADRWITIRVQFPHILRVDYVFGAINNYRVLNIDPEWIEEAFIGRQIRLIPFARTVVYDYIALFKAGTALAQNNVPNFWHYAAHVGLREPTPDIIELIGKKAAIDALVMLGQAIRPGIGSTSMSRDGISESLSYISSQAYGVYSGPITAYKEWIEQFGKTLKAKYRGLPWTTV